MQTLRHRSTRASHSARTRVTASRRATHRVTQPCEARAPELLAGRASPVHAWHQGCVEASHRPEHCFVCGLVPLTQTGVLVDKSPVHRSDRSEWAAAEGESAQGDVEDKTPSRGKRARTALEGVGHRRRRSFLFFWCEILSRHGCGRGAEESRPARDTFRCWPPEEPIKGACVAACRQHGGGVLVEGGV